jgi:Acetyl co-enzyme A carboxylase carboxyltransferase-like
MQLIDEIIKEPIGGAHLDYDQAAFLVDEALSRHLRELERMEPAARLDARYQKFRAMGKLGQAFADDGEVTIGPVSRPAAAAGSGRHRSSGSGRTR